MQSGATYPKLKRKLQYCDVCGTLLPAPGYFCIQCDPPEPPEPYPDKGLNKFQTFIRITLLGSIFIVVAVTKLDIKLQDLIPKEAIKEAPLKVAKDKDFKLLFKVNVSFANLRDKPSTKTGKILYVLTRDTQVEVLDQKGKWSKITARTEPGKPPHIGWIGSKLLDSEIK